MAREKKDRFRDPPKAEESSEPPGKTVKGRPARGVDTDREDPFQGDRDVLDEASPIDFVIEDHGKIVPDPLEDNPAQDYLINRLNLDDADNPSKHYSDDKDVIEDFAERQGLGDSGGKFLENLEEHRGVSPDISGDDVDAAWDKADVSGEETVGASNPTPDQDLVDELGESAGLRYRDDEPLDYSKVQARDRHRWELDPRSAEDQEDELEILDKLDLDEDEEALAELEELDDADDEDVYLEEDLDEDLEDLKDLEDEDPDDA